MFDFDGKMYCDCEKCGGVALVDGSVLLTSIPSQYRYHCPNCDSRGFIHCDMVYYLGVKKDNTEFYKELQEEQQEQM